jgi:lysine biosynthesis protein LysW
MARTRCPNCDAVITVAKPREGSVVSCDKCGVELEIVQKDPLEVDFLDDWQDDDWEPEY